jgi:integrase
MRQQGSIYARGEALWLYYYAKGDRRKSVAKLLGKSPGSVTWTDAVGALRRCLTEKAQQQAKGTLVTPHDEKITVAEVLARYCTHRLAEGVKRPVRFQGVIENLKDWWGALPAAKLTTAMLDAEVQARRAKGFAPSTIQTRLAGLYAALRYAQDTLPRLPARPKISVPHTRHGIWSAEEVERFCAVAVPWLADLTRFLACTGWRIGEVMSLTWDRVDLRGGLLYLDETKTDDPRQRPIEPALRAVLGRRLEARRLNCALVFHVDGLPIADDRFRYRWRQALQRAGLGQKYPHDFRRTAYHNLLLSGANLIDAMDLVGHKSLSSARRYARPSVDRMRAALEQRDATLTLARTVPSLSL